MNMSFGRGMSIKKELAFCILLLVVFIAFLPFGYESDQASGGYQRVYYMFFLALLISYGTFFERRKPVIPVSGLMFWIWMLSTLVVSFLFYNEYVNLKSLIQPFLLSSVFLLIILIRPSEDVVVRTLRCYLAINIIVIFVQFIIITLDLGYLDFHRLVFPWSRDTEYFKFGYYRLTGLHMEPGAYVNNTMLVYAAYIMIRKRVDIYSWLCLVANLMTLSFVGVAYTVLTVILILSLLIANSRNVVRASIYIFASIFLAVVIFIFLYMYTGFFEYFTTRVAGRGIVDSSTSYKLNNLMHLFQFEWYNIFFGERLEAGACSDCGYVNSNGVLFFMFFTHGLMGCVALAILFFAFLKAGLVGVYAFLAFSLSRYSPDYIQFWVVGALIFLRNSFDTNMYRDQDKDISFV